MKMQRGFSTINAYLLLSVLIEVFLTCGAHLICEELPIELCAYSVSSMGARCVLEREVMSNNDVVYKCQTSNVMGASSEGWIESDDCVEECGLSRMTVGISTDSLFDAGILQKLCSTRCSQSCPHLFRLHDELAMAESSFSLEDVCKTLNSPKRVMGEIGEFHGKIKGHFGAFRGDCGSFGCGGGGSFALPPDTSTYLHHNGYYYYGHHGHYGHGKHGSKGVLDPLFRRFYPYFPSPDALAPSSSDVAPSPSPITSE